MALAKKNLIGDAVKLGVGGTQFLLARGLSKSSPQSGGPGIGPAFDLAKFGATTGVRGNW